MKKYILALALMFVFVGSYAQEANLSGSTILPFDEKVRMGKLDNGLTYYVRPNNLPPGKAFFYLTQRVGSLQEDTNQRGLAHFLEHMCFNGTEHFPDHSLTDFMQRHGLGMGSDFGASTEMEYTTYQIRNVPTTQGTELLDSLLLVLRDWSHGLTLSDKEIDLERDVIVEEWRTRNVGRQRLIYNACPAIFSGSKYEECLPIGDMDIIKTFKPKLLRNYYERWYNPENQCIIVVGDFDAERMETAIKQMFSSLKRSKYASEYTETDLSANPQPIIEVQKDKELSEDELYIIRKMPKVSNEERMTLAHRRRTIIESMVSYMLNERASLAEMKPESPFTNPAFTFEEYFAAKRPLSFRMYFKPKENKTKECVEYGMTLLRQAAEHGFTNTECMRAAQRIQERLQEILSVSNRYNSDHLGNGLSNHYLTGSPIMEDTLSVQLYAQVLTSLNLDDLNNYVRDYLYTSDNSNLVVFTMNKEDGKRQIPTKQELLDILQKVSNTTTEPYEDVVSNKPLMTELPAPGEIAKIETWEYEIDKVTLKNGMRLLLANTKKNPGMVMMKAWAPGGINSKKNGTPIMNQFAGSAFNIGNIGGHSCQELQNMLYGKTIDLNWSVDQDETSFNGTCSTAELETMMQMFYLTTTSMQPDEEALTKRLKESAEALKAQEGTPMAVFQDSINNSWLDKASSKWLKIPTQEEVINFDYQTAYQIYRELMSDAGAFEVIIMGDYDKDQIIPLIQTYLASLPGTGDGAFERNLKGTHVDRNTKSKNHAIDFAIPMETPQSYICNIWITKGVDLSLENTIKNNLVCSILGKMLFAKVREEMGATYTPSASPLNSNTQKGPFIMAIQAIFPVKPEMTDIVKATIDELMKQIATNPDADLLQKSQEELLISHSKDMVSVPTYITLIESKEKYGLDFIADFEKLVKAQTVDSIKAFAQKLLKDGRHFSVTMRPQ